MEKHEINVLYVDDEQENLNSFHSSFRRYYNIFIAISAEEARGFLSENDIHVILTDQRMPEIAGVEFLESIIEDYPDPVRILVTGYADISAVVDAINKGHVYQYINKPWNNIELGLIIKNAFEVFSLKRENNELLDKYRKITISYSEVMKLLSSSIK